MELLRQWLAGVVGCAFAVSIIEELAPEGALRPLVRLTGALVLLLALLQPLGGAALSAALPAFDGLSEERAALEAQYSQEQTDALAAVIAERTGAYIEDKARALGADISVEVTVSVENGVPLPTRAVLHGEENAEVEAWVTRELGLAAEWRSDG